MTEKIEKSLLELDFAKLTQRTFTPSPAAWEDQVLYFLLLDRFSDGKEKAATGILKTVRCEPASRRYISPATPVESITTPGFAPAATGKEARWRV
jgi:hypothetical protein